MKPSFRGVVLRSEISGLARHVEPNASVFCVTKMALLTWLGHMTSGVVMFRVSDLKQLQKVQHFSGILSLSIFSMNDIDS